MRPGLVVLLLIALAACEGHVADPADLADGGGAADGGGGTSDGEPSSCTAAASYGAATISDPHAEALRTGDNPPYYVTGTGYLGTASPRDRLELRLQGTVPPGTYDLTGGPYTSFSCTTCLFVQTDFVEGGAEPTWDGGTSVDDYIATSGTLVISAISPSLQFQLEDVVLEEVEISGDLIEPSTSGCSTTIASTTYSASTN
jgi:hypothetical protein